MTSTRQARSLYTIAIAAAGGALVGAGIALGLGASWQDAADKRLAEQRGRDIAVLVCARCHAVGNEPASPDEKAPPFRELVSRLSDEGLQEQLDEGLALGHAPMPPWVFSPEQAEDLLGYILTLPGNPR